VVTRSSSFTDSGAGGLTAALTVVSTVREQIRPTLTYPSQHLYPLEGRAFRAENVGWSPADAVAL